MLQGAAELGRLLAAPELFFDRPVGIIADEDAVAVAVKSQRDAVASQQLPQQAEIGMGGLGGEETGRQDLARGVVLKAEQSETRPAAFQPVMGAGVEQEHLAFPCAAPAALVMGRGTALAR